MNSSNPPPLPFAPRPHRGENFTSWLLRLAGANHLTLDELRDVVAPRDAGARAPVPDYEQSPTQRRKWAKLARISESAVRSLDLKTQFPFVDRRWLQLPDADWSVPVCSVYCPQCFGEQMRNNVPLHLKAEWRLAFVTRCMDHATPLEQFCPQCGIDEPVSFPPTTARCRRCWHNLAQNPRSAAQEREPGIVALQRIAVDAFAGKRISSDEAPGLSAPQFRRLFSELIGLFTTGDFRHDRGTLIAALAPGRFRLREPYERYLDPPFADRHWREREMVLSALAELALPLARRTIPNAWWVRRRHPHCSPLTMILKRVTQHRRRFMAIVGRWPKSFQDHISRPYLDPEASPNLHGQLPHESCASALSVAERLEALCKTAPVSGYRKVRYLRAKSPGFRC